MYNGDDTMTADEFCEYARQNFVYAEEALFETESQYRSECALFGDAGPGQALRVRQLKQEVYGMAARYHQLTGGSLSADAYPYGWDFQQGERW